MNLRTLAACCLLIGTGGCATTENPTPAAPTHRHHHRHRAAATDPAATGSTSSTTASTDAPPTTTAETTPAATTSGTTVAATPSAGTTVAHTDPAPAASSGGFGTPPLGQSSSDVSVLNVRWVAEGAHSRLECEHDTSRVVVSPQSPFEPTDAAIVRTFQGLENDVLACRPPSDATGRLSLRAIAQSEGVLREIRFPGMRLSSEQAVCLGRALCGARLPTFRAAETAVAYDYVVYVPVPGDEAGSDGE